MTKKAAANLFRGFDDKAAPSAEAGGTLENAQAMAAHEVRAQQNSMIVREMRLHLMKWSGLRFKSNDQRKRFWGTSESSDDSFSLRKRYSQSHYRAGRR